MESRGISQVSAMILAMVSNVEDIGNSLVDLEFWPAGSQRALAPRHSPQSALLRQAIGCPYSEAGRRVQWRRPFSAISGLHWSHGTGHQTGGLPAVLCHLDRCATATPGKDAILVLAHRGHCVRQPKAGGDQSDHKNERNDIHDHTVAVIVRTVGPLIFCQVLDGRRRGG